MDYKIDFVIPLCKNNIIIKTVIEALIEFYNPRNIYIITPEKEITNLIEKLGNYNNIKFMAEETFFLDFYKLTSETIMEWYTYIDEKSREFGWWYQQIIKLGAINQINSISDPYIVWDADLIPLKKWDIYPTYEKPFYKFAILQKSHKNEFNKNEYTKSMKELINIEPAIPFEEGTFIPHHFIFHHCVIRSFLNKIINEKIQYKTWIEAIMKLSQKYYRFSEYKTIASYMNIYFPHLLHYHNFVDFGKYGIRYRESTEFIKNLKEKCLINENGISFNNFKEYILDSNNIIDETISYIQIEHL